MTMQINDPKTQGLKSVTPIQAGMLHIYISQFRSLAQDFQMLALSKGIEETSRSFYRGQMTAYDAVAEALTDALR